MSDRVKIYSHPERKKPSEVKSYIPEYQAHGLEPIEYRSAMVLSDTKLVKPSTDNPRLKRSILQQPYANSSESQIGRGKSSMPNVGNNVEQTWTSVDNQVIDDLSTEIIDPNEPMIDNNEFATDQDLGYQSGITAADISSSLGGRVKIDNSHVINNKSDATTIDLLSIVSDLISDSFLLIVSGVPICSGPKEEIEDQARALVFGEHSLCDGQTIPIEEIVILKKIKVKVGLFLD